MERGRRGLGALVVLGLFVSVTASGAPPEITASADEAAPSQDGTFELEWAEVDAEGREYHVQLAAPPDEGAFLDWYQGPAKQSFVSGIPTGEARVRVRARASGETEWGPWSETLVVPVRHHAMTKAVGLMALGFVVFSVVSGFVAVMAWRTREGARA